jgi:uracil phosphoribosyltransferase
VTTPLQETTGHQIKERISVIPILRAGLGMVDAMLELMPFCNVHHLGMYRDKGSLVPILYYNKLPREPDCDRVIILEPLIATAGTLVASVELIKDWGVSDITVMSVLASKFGLKKLTEEHPDIKILVGDVDDELTESGIILPGLGDVGDRLYCPGNKEHLVTTGQNKKRKRDPQ